MKVENAYTYLYFVSLDHPKDKRLPLKYHSMSYLFNTFNARTKATILEEMEIDFELKDEIFIFTIDGSKYKINSKNLGYRFFNGTQEVIASKVK